MKNLHVKFILLCFLFSVLSPSRSPCQSKERSSQKINVFVIGSTDKNHSPMVKKAEPMFQRMAAENNFEIHFTRDTAEINSANLAKYQVFIQLSIAYFDFSKAQQAAIQEFISSGRGWIGIHGAGLIGPQFANEGDWPWFWHLLGDAYYSPHPALQEGVLKIINTQHPVTKNLPASFSMRDEWYEFKSVPSPANVLAVADESTYKPNIPMGYHPIVWTNPDFHRVLYISVGHDTTACDNESYKILLRDAIKWVAESKVVEQKAVVRNAEPEFRALVIAERGENHESFVAAALDWLDEYSRKNNFEYDVINNADSISRTFLSRYKLFIQLNYPPYRWSDQSKAAFEDYIDNGKGAWIGFHHASLLGEFDGYPMWPWFSDFLGGITFKNYIARRADGEVHLEKKNHPAFRNLPAHFNFPSEEWYTFDKSPRANAAVLATVDESSYSPPSDIKMGDHPVIWTNPRKKAKNIYFLFGHHGGLFESKEFRQLFANTIQWAVKEK